MKKLIILLALISFTPNCWGGVDIDGADDYIEIVDHADFTPANLTAMAWINMDAKPSAGANDGVIAHYWGRDADSGAITQRSWALNIGESGGNAYVNGVVSTNGSFNADYNVLGSTSLATGTDYHVALVFDASAEVEIFLNGVSEGTATSSPASLHNSTQPVRIGLQFWSPGSSGQATNTFSGKINDVRVYDTDLSAAQILNIINPRLKQSFYDANEISYWRLDDHPLGTNLAGTVYRDSNPNGHNGTGSDADTSGGQQTAETLLSYPPQIQ